MDQARKSNWKGHGSVRTHSISGDQFGIKFAQKVSDVRDVTKDLNARYLITRQTGISQ